MDGLVAHLFGVEAEKLAFVWVRGACVPHANAHKRLRLWKWKWKLATMRGRMIVFFQQDIWCSVLWFVTESALHPSRSFHQKLDFFHLVHYSRQYNLVSLQDRPVFVTLCTNPGSTVWLTPRLSSQLTLFPQGQSECTDTGIRHPANKHKPVFLKELSKVWDNPKGILKWEPKFFGPQNTVLLDDSPYKGLKNPVREVSKEIEMET